MPIRKKDGEKYFEFADAGSIGLRFSSDGVYLRKVDSATMDLSSMVSRGDFYLYKDEILGEPLLYDFAVKYGILK